jgi:hypothetical protein
MKHGIIIKKDKFNQTKSIYNNGFLLKKYSNQPLLLKFRNDMVNDYNQHLCVGWSFPDIDNTNIGLYNRVLNGLKPLGVIIFKTKELADNFKSELGNLDKLDNDIVYYKNSYYKFHFCFSRKGKLSELFDLNTLKEDYYNSGIEINIEEVKNNEIKDFYKNWDDDLNLWITGLILGYPIENTISLYNED